MLSISTADSTATTIQSIREADRCWRHFGFGPALHFALETIVASVQTAVPPMQWLSNRLSIPLLRSVRPERSRTVANLGQPETTNAGRAYRVGRCDRCAFGRTGSFEISETDPAPELEVLPLNTYTQGFGAIW